MEPAVAAAVPTSPGNPTPRFKFSPLEVEKDWVEAQLIGIGDRTFLNRFHVHEDATRRRGGKYEHCTVWS